eukprot:365148-Chlamydomonas_euryale.AAC.4
MLRACGRQFADGRARQTRGPADGQMFGAAHACVHAGVNESPPPSHANACGCAHAGWLPRPCVTHHLVCLPANGLPHNAVRAIAQLLHYLVPARGQEGFVRQEGRCLRRHAARRQPSCMRAAQSGTRLASAPADRGRGTVPLPRRAHGGPSLPAMVGRAPLRGPAAVPPVHAAAVSAARADDRSWVGAPRGAPALALYRHGKLGCQCGMRGLRLRRDGAREVARERCRRAAPRNATRAPAQHAARGVTAPVAGSSTLGVLRGSRRGGGELGYPGASCDRRNKACLPSPARQGCSGAGAAAATATAPAAAVATTTAADDAKRGMEAERARAWCSQRQWRERHMASDGARRWSGEVALVALTSLGDGCSQVTLWECVAEVDVCAYVWQGGEAGCQRLLPELLPGPTAGGGGSGSGAIFAL